MKKDSFNYLWFSDIIEVSVGSPRKVHEGFRDTWIGCSQEMACSKDLFNAYSISGKLVSTEKMW